MSKLKLALASAASAVVLPLGVALPAAADYNNCVGDSCNTNTEVTTNTDASTDNSIHLGDCAVYNKGDVDQGQGGAESDAENKIEEEKSDENSQSSSSSASNSQDGSVNISTDCSSTTNVTNVHEAAVAGAQVSAPAGGVSAGAGSAASTLGSIFGLIGSIGTAGLGLFVRKQQ